jgi:hypothetical protein
MVILRRITGNFYCGHSPVQEAVFFPSREGFPSTCHIHLAYFELYPYVNHFNLVMVNDVVLRMRSGSTSLTV